MKAREAKEITDEAIVRMDNAPYKNVIDQIRKDAENGHYYTYISFPETVKSYIQEVIMTKLVSDGYEITNMNTNPGSRKFIKVSWEVK